MDHDEVRSLIAAYALGAVPEDEVGMIRDHILSCDRCMAEADGFADVTSTLALSVDPVDLPAGFADRVLRQAVPVETPRVQAAPARRGWWTRFGAAGAAAMTAAALILGLLFVDARLDVARERKVLAAVLDRNGIELTGDGVSATAVDVDGRSVFAVSGLDDAPEGKTYQLWLMRGSKCPSNEPASCEIVSAGTFEVADGVAIMELDHEVSDWDHSAVTVERDGGVDAPTSAPVVSSFSA